MGRRGGGAARGEECSANGGDGERLLSVDFVLKCSCAANSAGRLSI